MNVCMYAQMYVWACIASDDCRLFVVWAVHSFSYVPGVSARVWAHAASCLCAPLVTVSLVVQVSLRRMIVVFLW